MNIVFSTKNLMIFLLFIINIIKSNTEGFTSILNGNSNGGKSNYYLTLYIGKSKKSKTFLIDTTGSLISSSCNLYSSFIDKSHNFYEIEQEKDIINCNNNTCDNHPYSSCINKQCYFEYSYNNSTINGIYVNQYISFMENAESHYLSIGCTQNETNYFMNKNADGIFGLNDNNNSIVNILYKEKIIPKNMFSICLNQNDGGYLSLGKTKEEFHYQNNKITIKNIISYIPYNIIENGKYSIEMDSLYIEKGDNLIKNNEKHNSIIDTLSAKTYLIEKIYNNLINEFLIECSKKKGNCYNIKKDEEFGYCSNFKSKQKIIKSIDKYWPTLTISFNRYNHVLSPHNYFIAYSSTNDIKACIGFDKTNKNYNILGTTFMNGYEVIFDNENKNLGFIESNCEVEIKKVEEDKNRVFDDPVNVIIISLSVGGIIILIIVIILLYREFNKTQPTRKGYIRQVDVINSINSYIDSKK